MDNKYICVILDDEGYISSYSIGFSDLPIYKNVINIDGLGYDMLIASKITKGEDGLFIPVFDENKYQSYMAVIKSQEQILDNIPTPQEQIEVLKSENALLKESLERNDLALIEMYCYTVPGVYSVDFFVGKINEGRLTIADVPDNIKADVEAAIEKKLAAYIV